MRVTRNTGTRAAVLLLIGSMLALGGGCKQKPSERPGHSDENAKRDRLERILSYNNTGIGYLEQFLYEKAAGEFSAAIELDPAYLPTQVNLGIALFNQNENDGAIAQMAKVLEQDPANRSARYIRGMAHYVKNQPAESRREFEILFELDPDDPDTLFWLGKVYEAGNEYDKAIEHYKKAVAVDPDKVSALYRISQNLIRKARKNNDKLAEKESRVYLERYKQARIGVPNVQENYLTHGHYALATWNPVKNPVGVAPSSVRFAVMNAAGIDFSHGASAGPDPHAVETWLEQIASAQAPDGGLRPEDLVPLFGSGAVFLDYDNDGDPDLYLVNAGGGGKGAPNALFRNDGSGTFTDVSREAGVADDGQGMGAWAGDFDNDGFPDLYITNRGPNVLYRNRTDGTFENVAAKQGVAGNQWSLGAALVDYDHDADLDIFVANYRDPGPGKGPGKRAAPGLAPLSNRLLRNNGNGSFEDVTSSFGLDAPGPNIAVACTDVDNDRDIDLILTSDAEGLTLLYNNRHEPFSPAPIPGAKEPGLAFLGAVAVDLNHDKFMDIIFSSTSGLHLSMNKEGTLGALEPLTALTGPVWGMTALDADYDGDVDLMVAAGGRLVFLENRGGAFIDASSQAGLLEIDASNARAVTGADVDSDGDLDILVTRCGGEPILLRNDGGNTNHWLELSLKGRSGRSNRDALGVKVELMSGSIELKREAVGAGGYLSQDLTPMRFGLGGKDRADFVHILWPSGIVQAELALEAGKAHVIEELDRQPTSCPMLYTWDGAKFAFCTDVMGSTALGYLLAPGEYYYPDPDEYYMIDREKVKPRDGMVEMVIAEHLQETTYLDRVRLLAVDHPEGVRALPNERFHCDGRVPEYFFFALSGIRPVRAAWDGEGNDVTELLKERDLRHPTVPLIEQEGYAELHELIVDLGDLSKAKDVVLMMSGTLIYPLTTGNFSASQKGLEYIPARLEAEIPDGRWINVTDDMGFPCGLFKTMVCDLTGRLPRGAHRIRITSNAVCYWDQIQIATRADRFHPEGEPSRDRDRWEASVTSEGKFHVSVLKARAARLGHGGYPKETSVLGSIHVWDFQDKKPSLPWMRQGGSYTRYGDVRELLDEADDKLVVMAHGDEVALGFETAGLPQLPDGWVRDYCIFTHGYCKDMDYYTAASETVEPLPFRSMAGYPPGKEAALVDTQDMAAYREKWNTRKLEKKLH